MMEGLLLTALERLDPLPGPNRIIAGDAQAGYYGTLPGTDFVTGDQLASLLLLSLGTSINSSTDWLKFSYKGKTQFVPKLPLRVDISWDMLNNVGAVMGTNVVTIKGRQYKVRLMKGANSDPYTGANNVADDPKTWQSEYNALMYRVCTVNPPSQTLPNFVAFTQAALGMQMAGGSQLCQEHSSPSTGETPGILCRAGITTAADISTASSPAPSYTSGRGWRPVIELA